MDRDSESPITSESPTPTFPSASEGNAAGMAGMAGMGGMQEMGMGMGGFLGIYGMFPWVGGMLPGMTGMVGMSGVMPTMAGGSRDSTPPETQYTGVETFSLEELSLSPMRESTPQPTEREPMASRRGQGSGSVGRSKKKGKGKGVAAESSPTREKDVETQRSALVWQRPGSRSWMISLLGFAQQKLQIK